MSLGAVAFLNPWLLAALLSLPVIYWLLRTIPPRPKEIEFPPTRILAELENREKTPSTTPWWLLLIRLLAAALVIFALAEPILDPLSHAGLKGKGPVVLAVDNGWASGPAWAERLEAAGRVVDEAEAQSRPVVVVATAPAAKSFVVRLETPADARSSIAALISEPFAPQRIKALSTLETALEGTARDGVAAVWLTDGIDHDGTARVFADGLAALSAGGTFAVAEGIGEREALGLLGFVSREGKLAASVLRAGGGEREGMVEAFSARGQRLGEAPFRLGPGAASAEVTFELPLELRNQVTRLEIAAERSAGAVSLIDSRSQWQRVGLVSGEAQEQSQPLLAPLYYLQKAIQPFAEIIRSKDQNLAVGVDDVLKQQSSVVMLADIGTLSGEVKERVGRWVEKGGVLVRFAGPRLEQGGDDLLPVPLRTGGRALGGALSWSSPQPLAPFDDTSLFAGLSVSPDVTVRRQVLADPARLGQDVEVWARLGDGTPLVTAARRGQGRIVLFHVTANTDWSSLPISGLFVEMLRRITMLGGFDPAAAETAGEDAAAASAGSPLQSSNEGVLAPVQTLDGFGVLRPPPPTAEAIPATGLAAAKASLEHPPGYYGAAGLPRALNVLSEGSALSALPPMPAGTERRAYESASAMLLKPWLLAAALALLFADIIAVLVLQGGLAALGRRAGARAASAGTATALVAAVMLFGVPEARAQTIEDFERDLFENLRRPQLPLSPGRRRFDPSRTIAGPDGPAQMATERVTLGYVRTGNAQVDETSRLGLMGLSQVLTLRTAVEPRDPMGVDIVKDEIAFFPVLYWPVLPEAQALSDATLAKIDAFMKQGGMIIFDTRDYSAGVPQGMALGGRSGPALERLIGRLDLPRLEPVPEDHVLTKSFYLLRAFPGRWSGGELWVEADQDANGESRKARRADGVSSILITANDFASAWALDRTGRPLYAVAPGGEQQREMAFRAGINIVMHALTGNYKADQVHVPALLERLGQ